MTGVEIELVGGQRDGERQQVERLPDAIHIPFATTNADMIPVLRQFIYQRTTSRTMDGCAVVYRYVGVS